MIPILYEQGESLFLTNGIGRLTEAISCTVDKVRNGVYDLEMVYPMTGKRYADLAIDKIILARHSDSEDRQPFRIYKISRPLSGLVTVYAQHISRDLGKVTIMPFTADGIRNTMAAIPNNTIISTPFEFWTDKTTANTYTLSAPMSVMSMLGGVEGSILDVFGGGDYEFDKWTVKLHDRMGADNGVTIRYGKNLTDLNKDTDGESQYNAVVPYYLDAATGDLLMLPEGMLTMSGAETFLGVYTNQAGEVYTDQSGNQYTAEYATTRVVPLDLSEYWETTPTVEQLRTKATAYLANNGRLTPDESLRISFAALWQTDEYADYAPLQRVAMCDTVHVYYSALGVNAAMRVVRTVYDVLAERYNSVELGMTAYNLSGAIRTISAQSADAAARAASAQAGSAAQSMVEKQTALITGQTGGYFVTDTDEAGKPIGWLLMDTPDKTTARNVIRANQSGIGFSRNGYNGPYISAWTIDGSFNADFIQTGTLNADLITAGGMSADRITSGTIDAARLNLTDYAKFTDLSNAGSTTINGSNITTGTLSANRIKAGVLSDNAGKFSLNMTTGVLSMQDGTFTGTVNATAGTIGGFSVDADEMVAEETATSYGLTINPAGNASGTVLNTTRNDWQVISPYSFGIAAGGSFYGAHFTASGFHSGNSSFTATGIILYNTSTRNTAVISATGAGLSLVSNDGNIELNGATLTGSTAETVSGTYNGLTITLYKNAGCVSCYIRGTTTAVIATASAYVTLFTPADSSWMPTERLISYHVLTAAGLRGQVNPSSTNIQIGYTRNASNTAADIPAGTAIYCFLTWAAK